MPYYDPGFALRWWVRRLKTVPVLAVVLLSSSGACRANESDGRRVIVEDSYPWSSIAKLYNSSGGACTGILVGQSTALTAAHCLYSRKTRRFLPPAALHLLFGYRRGDYRVDARVVRYEIGAGYDPNNETVTLASDWAVLTLLAAGPGTVPIEVSEKSAEPGMTVALAGFDRTAAYILTGDKNCRVQKILGPIIISDCPGMPGDSGGPLLALDGSNRWRLLGLQVAIANAPITARTTISLSIPGTSIKDAIRKSNNAATSGAEKN